MLVLLVPGDYPRRPPDDASEWHSKVRETTVGELLPDSHELGLLEPLRKE